MKTTGLRVIAGPPKQEWATTPLPGALQMAPVPVLGEPAVAYWNRGIDLVPHITGAAGVMDCRDLVDACARLGVLLPLRGRVMDIGCGTARWQKFCQAYQGFDISPSAVEYAAQRGIVANLIGGYGPSALDSLIGGAEWICCFSVFTHISFEERHDYLDAFHRIAPNLIVDIIPGDGGGGVGLWTADVRQFEADIAATGWALHRVAERVSPDAVCHRYYWLTRP